MAITKTVTQIMTSQTSTNSGQTASTDCTIIDTESCIGLALTCSCIMSTAATVGATVHVYGSYDSTSFDSTTNPYWQFSIPYLSSTSAQQITASIPNAPHYLRARVTNLSTAQDITAINLWSHVQTA